MKKLLLIIVCLSVYQLNAQQSSLSLLSTAGDYFDNGSYSISWSLGELAIETFTQAENILTQGFQQSKLSTVGINEYSINNNRLIIYPNPAVNEIYISSNNKENQEYLVQIFDLLGSKKIEQKIFFDEQKSKIKLNSLEPGAYMMVFYTKDKKIYQTFLFQKIEF